MTHQSLACSAIMVAATLALHPPARAATSPAPVPPPPLVDPATPQDLCASFQRQVDGSWVALRAVDVPAPDGMSDVMVNPRAVFTDNVTYSDVPVAEVLKKACVK